MKLLRRTLLATLLLGPTALCLVTVLVLFTEAGTRSVVQSVERMLPLQIDYSSGTLGGQLHLARLQYDSAGASVELRRVVAELEPDCLWRAAICFRQLRVEALDITLLAESSADQEQPATGSQGVSSLIEFPLTLEAQALDIASVRVGWSGGHWQQGALNGSVRLRESTIEVYSADIEAPKLTLLPTDSEQDVEASPIVLPSIDLPLTLVVDQLSLANPHWDINGTAQQLDVLTLGGTWHRTALELKSVEVRSAALGELLLSGRLEFSGSWPLQAQATLALREQFHYPRLFNGTLAVMAEGDLSALALQVSSDSAVTVQGGVEVDVLSAGLPFSMQATATSGEPLALGELTAMPEGLQDVTLLFPFDITASGSAELQHVKLSGAARGLGYDVLDIALQGQHGDGQLSLSELAVQSPEGDNALHVSGEFLLSPDIRWSLTAQSSGLDLPALDNAPGGRVNGRLHLSGSVQWPHWQVEAEEVAVQGQVNGMPASIEGFTGMDSELRLAHSDLQVDLNGAQLSVQSATVTDSAHVRLQVDDIGRWYEGSSGLLEVEGEISPDRNQVQLSGHLQQLEWSAMQVEKASFSGRYDASAHQFFSVDSVFRGVQAGALSFPEMQLSARGDARAQSIALASSGDVAGEFDVSGTVTGGTWQGALAATRLQTSVGEWQLSEPVALRASPADEQFFVAAHCWRNQFADVCPGNAVIGAQGNGSVGLHGNLEILAGVLPPDLDMTGQVEMQLEARWKPESPMTLHGTAQSRAVVLTQYFEEGESADFGWDAADFRVDSTVGGLQFDAGVQRDGRRVLALHLLLPPDRDGDISGTVSVDQVRMAGLTPFVPALSELSGELSGEISLAGSVDTPRGFGLLTLNDGLVALEGNPTVLNDLHLNLDVRGTAASIAGTGVLGGGALEISGSVESAPELRLELDVRGENQSILYPPTTELLISEALQLTLTRGLLILTGNLTVLDGVLEIEELPEGSVALSNSVVEIDSNGEVLHETLPFKVRMNVQIHIEDKLRVTGSLLEAHLGGDLRLQQRPGQPLQLFGSLNTNGGEFRAYQARLQIKRGTISFTGPPANPSVNVRAERRINNSDVTVGVHVQGPLEDSLQLDLYSDPSMGQAQAMSYLIRGRGIDAGAGLDGTTAALSLASGVVNRSELVRELNRIPGLSHVEFGAEGSETDATATLSGYFGERLYLSYGIGVYEPVNVLTSRFYFRSRLWLEVISSIENSVDLYYSFDID